MAYAYSEQLQLGNDGIFPIAPVAHCLNHSDTSPKLIKYCPYCWYDRVNTVFLSLWSVLTDRPPPIIRQGPSNQTLGVDSVALLKCQASGEPVPTISWLKDGVSLLGKDPRMSLQELGSLQIKNIRVRVKSMVSYFPSCRFLLLHLFRVLYNIKHNLAWCNVISFCRRQTLIDGKAHASLFIVCICEAGCQTLWVSKYDV